MANDKKKSKRDRGWDADGKAKALPALDALMPQPQGNDPRLLDYTAFEKLLDWLYQYACDMNAWGKDMRDDLIRLEGQAGFPTGDPGDPPGGPPE